MQICRFRKTAKIVERLDYSPPNLDSIQTALNGTTKQKNKRTAKIAVLELSMFTETAGDDIGPLDSAQEQVGEVY